MSLCIFPAFISHHHSPPNQNTSSISEQLWTSQTSDIYIQIRFQEIAFSSVWTPGSEHRCDTFKTWKALVHLWLPAPQKPFTDSLLTQMTTVVWCVSTFYNLRQSSGKHSGNRISVVLAIYCFDGNWHISICAGETLIALQPKIQHSGIKYRLNHLTLTTHMQKAHKFHSLTTPVHHQDNIVTLKINKSN